MTSQMLLHCGGRPATLEELRHVPMPAETETYKPVGHFDLVANIGRVAGEMLTDSTFKKGVYALSRDGNRLFGLHVYETGDAEMGLSIGFRNSYDKSMSVGIAVGASVFVCDNLALTGEVTVMRKHTQNVLADLEVAILRVVYRARASFIQIQQSAETMKATPLSDDDAFRMLGVLFGRNILTSRQLNVAKTEWLKPSHKAFEPRTRWSLYNAATTALKTTPPHRILERHLQLHGRFTSER